jgi:phosphotriesterase-related protein
MPAAAAGESRKIETVLGPVGVEALGPTSMHEHVFIDATVWHEPPPSHDPPPSDEVDMKSIGYLRWNPGAIADNLILDDEEIAGEELKLFRDAGGAAIVDLTCVGIGPSPLRLADVSRHTGVQIVAGCGFYVDASHPDWLETLDDDEITDLLIRDLTKGIDGTNVKAGIIGEIGTSSPLTDREARVLAAAARAAAATGAAINVHVDEGGMEGPAVVEELDAAEADLGRVVLSHMDQCLDPGYHRALLDSGVVLSFDTFGSHSLALAGRAEPNDLERMEAVAGLVRDGFSQHLVLGCDVWAKYMLRSFGGLGYEHLLRRIIPSLQQNYGLADHDIEAMLVHNPRRLLAIPCSQ